MELNKLKTDSQKEVEGVWHDLGEGARIKIARAGNKAYAEYIQKAMKPHRKAIKAGTLSDKVAEKIVVGALAETVLLDWEGFTEGGKAVKYSIDKAKEILSNPDFHDFKEMVAELADDAEAYRTEVLEDDLKN